MDAPLEGRVVPEANPPAERVGVGLSALLNDLSRSTTQASPTRTRPTPFEDDAERLAGIDFNKSARRGALLDGG
ncbi:MAG: hypothetical protein CL933_10235 [Deltaproteobacteria bacterium]|nr:hypothetical protein [Deltaproteobacteria bacterium]